MPLPNLIDPILYRPASQSTPGSPPFVPSDIWKAYDFLPIYSKGVTGSGTRIAIIDAYGDPSISSDLSSFDSIAGLPSTTVNIYYPDGVPRGSVSGWAIETALDVEWAHAIAPGATIDLVIGQDNSLQHLYDAVRYVANNLPQEYTLSMSWGDFETNYPTTGAYTITTMHQLFVTITGHGTSIFASSGDSGSTGCCAIQYPASDPLVVGVGGTTLQLDTNASYVSEQAWSGSTAGDSIVFAKPSWQNNLGGQLSRSSVDVSYDADPNTGVIVIQGGSQLTVGGTSAGSPQWAALIDLAAEANSKGLGAIAPRLYNATAYHDVRSGFNGYYNAGTGWDYPTGLGTPDASGIISAFVSPLAVGVADSRAFQGLSVTTKGALGLAPFTGQLTGTLNVVARNSTTGIVGFNKTFTVNGLQLQSRGSAYMGSLVFNIPMTPYPLSSNLQVSANSSVVTYSVTVTRSIDPASSGVVNIQDLALVASAFNTTSGSPGYDGRADIDGSGAVNIVDLAYVASYFNAAVYN